MASARTMIIALIVFATLISAHSAADQGSWQFEADGITYELDNTGNIIRLFSKYSQPVPVPDRRGIRNAQIIAEERAKATIVRFIDQSVSDTMVIEQLESEMSAAAARSGGDSGPQLSSEAIRTSISNITQITRSQAANNLRGVVRLEDGYDAELGEAWVVVGISRSSSDAARDIGAFISGDFSSSQSSDAPSAEDHTQRGSETERRRNRIRDF